MRTAQIRELRAPGNYIDAGSRHLMGRVRRHAEFHFASSQGELLAALAGRRANATIQLPAAESLWAAFAPATTGEAELPEFRAPRCVPNCCRAEKF